MDTETAVGIVEQLKPRSPFNVQLKVTSKGVQVFEINPRFSTTSILSMEAGVNEFDLAIEAFDKEDFSFKGSFKERVFLFRRWESIFIKKDV